MKPCPEEKRREQGFSGETTPGTRKSIKDTKKILQEKVFNESTAQMNVTLIRVSRPVVCLERGHRTKEFGMKQKSLFYCLPERDRSKWFVS